MLEKYEVNTGIGYTFCLCIEVQPKINIQGLVADTFAGVHTQAEELPLSQPMTLLGDQEAEPAQGRNMDHFFKNFFMLK